MRHPALSGLSLFLTILMLVADPAARGQAASPRAAADRAKQGARKPGAPAPGKGKPAPSAQGGVKGGRARYLVPGIGGAAPPPRPRNPGAPFGVPLKPLYGPPNPHMQGQPPAPVAVPGQGLPGLPQTGAPGLPDLQARPVSPLLYGVNVVWGDSGGGANWQKDSGAKARRLAQLMKGAGVTNTRIGIGWGDVERVRGKYDWRETDRFIRYVSGLGVSLICVVAVTPDWAVDRSPDVLKLFRDRGVANLAGVRAPKPEFYADLGRFAYACAQRYKGQIKRWEFWNEPDGMGMPIVVKDAQGQAADIRYGGDPAVYTQMLRVFAANVRRADPQAQIAVGGLQVPKTEFLEALYAGGAKPYFDAIALHPYNERGLIAFDWIDKCREVVLRQKDDAKTFWLTEWGWATSPGSPNAISEAHQARLIRESLAGMRARPFITQASYHTLNDWRTNEGDPRSLIAMGLCTYNLMPRPGYFAFREMASGLPAEPGRAYARVNLTGGLPMAEEAGVRGSAVNVTVDADKPGGPLPPLWEGFSQGSESADARFFLPAVPRLKALGAKLVRFDPFPGPDSVQPETAGESGGSETRLAATGPVSARPFAASRVDWTYTDAMVEAVTRAGARPMFNFATMPTALSAPSGNSRFPRDPAEWAGFVQAVVQRYNGGSKGGIACWELSNEPDTGGFAQSEWLRFYETFARAVTGADPSAKVGGPAVSGSGLDWVKALADYCAANRVPLHFLSWHAYGLRPAEMAGQVREMRAYLARYPALKDVELILDEWNASAPPSPQNDGRYAAVYAASVIEALADAGPARALFHEVKEGADFRRPSEDLTGRWGLLTHTDRPKPVYNAFRLLSRLEGQRLPAVTEDTDIHALAVRDSQRVAVLLWSFPQASDTPAARPLDTPLRVRLRGLPWKGATRGEQWTLDAAHGDLRSRPDRAEVERVAAFRAPAGSLDIPVVLSPQGMALVELTPAPASPVEVSLETPRYVVYGGSGLALTAQVKNRTTAPQAITLRLSGSDPALLPATDRTRRVVVAPGASTAVPFRLRIPEAVTEAQEFFRVEVSRESRVESRELKKAVASRKSQVASPKAHDSPLTTHHSRLSTLALAEASVAVKLAAPLQVRLEPERVDIARPGAPPDSAESLGHLRVVLENRAEMPLKAGVVSGSAAQSVTIPPRNAATLDLGISPPSNLPGNYAVPVKALTGDRIAATLEAQVGVPVLCRYAGRPLRINGDLSEWTEAAPIVLDRASRVREKRWGGPDDLSAQALTLWDEQNLYLAVTVTDDTHFQPFAPEDMWRGDSIQFALDTRRTARLDQEGYDAGDYEFGIATGRLHANVYRFAGGGKTPGPVPAIQAVVRRIGNRTLYEAAIPWSELAPMRPADGAIAGFSLLINDSDGQARGYMEWAGGIGDAKRPGMFIGLRLVKD